MRTSLLVVGMVLLVVGAQGAIKQIVEPADAGLMAWLPGGFPGQLAGHVVVAVLGMALAARGARQAPGRQ